MSVTLSQTYPNRRGTRRRTALPDTKTHTLGAQDVVLLLPFGCRRSAHTIDMYPLKLLATPRSRPFVYSTHELVRSSLEKAKRIVVLVGRELSSSTSADFNKNGTG